MATHAHRNTLIPDSRKKNKTRNAGARQAAAAAPETQEEPSLYTRNAAPLAISWFLIPMLLLILSAHFGWGF